jgi:hypothetical protein
MDYRRDSHGAQTFLEHWGTLLSPIALIAYSFATQLFLSLASVNGGWWLGFCAGAFAAQIAGAWLIGYAKMPLYRSGRFFTFGVRFIPAPRVAHYRWGWRVFAIGVLLSLGLLMGRL